MSNITPALVKELRSLTNAAMMDCKKALDESGGDIEKARDILRKKGQLIANKKASRETKEGKILIKQSSDGSKIALVKLACETDFVARNEKFTEYLNLFADLALTSEKSPEFANVSNSEGKSVKEILSQAIAEVGENMILEEPVVLTKQSGRFFSSYTHMNDKIGVILELEGENKNKEAVVNMAKDICMHIAASNVQSISADDLDPSVVEKERKLLIEQAMESGKPKEIAEKMVEGRMRKFKEEVCLLEQPFVKDPSLKISALIDKINKESGTSVKILAYHKQTV